MPITFNKWARKQLDLPNLEPIRPFIEPKLKAESKWIRTS